MALFDNIRHLYQLGYVTRDLDRAVDAYQEAAGPLEFMVSEQAVTVRADGEVGELRMRVALATSGRHQIEIIEPQSGLTGIYTQGLDFAQAPFVFHHVGIGIFGPHANWQALEAEMQARGQSFKLLFPPALDPDPFVQFGYVDTRGLLGHYTEYLWWGPVLAGSPTFPVLEPDRP